MSPPLSDTPQLWDKLLSDDPAAATTALLVIVASLALLLNLRRILYPNSSPDPSRSEPVPPGSLGCPYVGHTFAALRGSTKFGTGHFYHARSAQLGNPSLWKFSFLGRPRVSVSGGKLVRELLGREFKPDGITTGLAKLSSGMLGYQSLMCEPDRARHRSLRKLVGAALTPEAVSLSVPALCAAAERQAEKLLLASTKSKEEPLRMADACTDFTLEVAWRQILGLKLEEEEVPVFQRMVGKWIGGLGDIRLITKIGVSTTQSYKAKQYLLAKIEERICELEQHGPDSTTLSGMVFSTDDDEKDTKKRLTREEVIDNALLLILAGSETSASTLANAMLSLGVHRRCWDKLVDEQKSCVSRHGNTITKEMIDKECPYLEAVIKETMRIKPLAVGAPRITKETVVLDGKQIPRGWVVNYNVLLTHERDPITFKEDYSHMDIRQGFQPSRWLNEKTKPSSDFIPMIAGPRYCLGANLAYTEMKVFLAVLARTIDFELVGNIEELEWKRLSVIPKPADGVLVTTRPAGK